MNRWVRHGLPAAAAVALLSASAAAQVPVRSTVVALSPDHRWKATASHLAGEKLGRVILSDGTDVEIAVAEVPGDVRSVLFSPEADRIYLLSGRSVKRGPDEVHLWISPVPDLEFKRRVRVAGGSTALSYWTEEQALLLASPGQIRTLLQDGARSGPLFPVPGPNLALASIGGGSRLLIGKPGSLQIVDLSQAPGRESMPLVGNWSVPSPVRTLRVPPDATGAQIWLEDGSLWNLDLQSDPPDLQPSGSATDAVSEAATTFASVPKAARRITTRPTIKPAAETDPGPPTPATRVEPPSAGKPSEPPEAPATQQEPTAPQPKSQVQIPVPRESTSTPPADARPAAAEPDPDPLPAGSISGFLEGDLEGRTLFVTAHGPDNILREAARVPVSADGRWNVDGLSPGRYRVQPNSGGAAAVVAEPRYRTVVVPAGGAGARLKFRILRFH